MTKNKAVSLSYLAKELWPGNDSAKSYLTNKLAGRRPWTDADETNARKVLHELGVELQGL
ncbi:MAG TPA: hypothetical protein VGB63_08615 [Pedobacter sp.]